MNDWLIRPEDQWYERKSFRIKPRDLAKTIVGFANAEGGTIAVGIREGNFEGKPSAKQENDLRQTTFDHTDPTVVVDIREEEVAGQTLLLFVIEPSARVHYTMGGDCFLRVGDETRALNLDEVLELRYTKGEQQFDATPLTDVAVEELVGVEEYAQRIGSASAYDALRARHLVTAKEEVTTAAYLLFHPQPQQRFHNAHVRVLVWNEPHRLPGYQQQLVQDQRFEGPLPQQIQQAQEFILEVLPTVKRLGTSGIFEEHTLIPHEVWLEGLVNAVIHRSYSLIGDHIRFEIFPDRITISSPGRFPGLADPSRPESIARFARNPLVARVMAELDVGQELGEGIRRMFAGMRRVGFQDPIYQQTSGSVLLTLSTEQKLNDDRLRLLPKHSDTVLAALQLHGVPLSTGEVAEAVGISVPSARRALQALRQNGIIQWQGKGPNDPRAAWSVEGPLR
ncbi:RNA-binding domain-containing protein [Corynebacterium cystitidis]|uniref:RNA-binding domain-containing protein n=1 Tax=Corynebacterium cystitidis TaxID=35757 RepID=UPI00211E076C|nr:RNA-binding domain-containing protein [Corynebacterium cystitidis]